MRVLLFDGQGSFQSPQSPQSPSTQFTSPPSSPLASLFIRQAHTVLRARLTSLRPSLQLVLDSGATQSVYAQLRDGSLALPTQDILLLSHPLVALPSLYITQVVSLFAILESDPERVLGHQLELIGYSSGLLPALLIATSFPHHVASTSYVLTPASQLLILSNALALLDLAVALGVYCQIARISMLDDCGIALDDPCRDWEWSSVLFGTSREELESKIHAWNALTDSPLFNVHLTAETSPTCHTLSGCPLALREFIASLTNTFTPRLSISSLSSSVSSNGSQTDSDAILSSSTSSVSTTTSKLSLYSLQEPKESFAPSIRKAQADSCAFNCSIAPPSPVSSTYGSSTPVVHAMPSLPQAAPSAIKPLGIFTLFHAAIPHLKAARDGVLSELFYNASNNDGNGFMGTSNDTNDNNYDENNGYTHANETNTVLSTLRLSAGYTLYDSHTGLVIPCEMSGRALVERILDMILLQRVEFPKVLNVLGHVLYQKTGSKVELINLGPGSGLARVVMRALKERVPRIQISMNDASNVATQAYSAKGIPSANSHEPIAIVGMAVNLPGARNINEFWDLLQKGINTVEEIPQTRFSISPYATPNGNLNRKMKTRFGNFLPDSLHSSFDNSFFRISPREARSLDPQVRVLMRVGLQAIEAAGLVISDFMDDEHACESEGMMKSEDVGCFVGVATNDYVFNLRNEMGVHYATGTLPAFLAGRLAYALHVSGPSVVLNTACSSSFVALHQACRALQSGDCKAALAGGVHVVTSPDMYIGLDRAHFLSPTGNCKPWDASADGYCRAEGCGIFVLKRLSEALASSDNILGVIRGTEVNQSAAAVSITRPHAPTQSALFTSLLDKSGVKPEDVSLAEAHGTGTQAGDPEELRSIRDALSPDSGSNRNQDSSLTVTSVKGNIGHAEAASGAASLAKVLLMFRHQLIPPQVGLVNLNPKIEPLENDFTRINAGTDCIEWTPNKEGKRIALVNNFGAAGSNAALLVEDAYVHRPSAPIVSTSDHVLLGLSAETEESLLRLRDSYLSSLPCTDIINFAYTATARRKLRPWRMAVSACSSSDVVRALQDAKPVQVAGDERKIVFVFSGQGGQYIGMGKQLYGVAPTFRSIVDECHAKLLTWGYPGVLAIINPKEPSASGLAIEDELVAFQCANFVLQCALYNMWKLWGVEADAVIGHSLGEYASLVAADVLSLDSALRLVARRARLMVQYCARDITGMLAIRLSAQTVSDTIAKLDGCESLAIACYNGPKDVVVGGPHEQLTILKEHLESVAVKCITVNVPFAYHTEAMEPILDELTAFARNLEFKAPRIPVVSNVTGKIVRAGDASVFSSVYFALHCRQPVNFDAGANDLVRILGPTGAFIEVGPHPTTLPMLSQATVSTGAVALPSLHKKMSVYASLTSSLSRIFTMKHNVTWGKVFRELYPLAKCVEIPGYPLVETEFWTPYVEEFSAAQVIDEPSTPTTKYAFLGTWTQRPSSQDSNVSEFETPISALAEHISGHRVSSFPLCPASVYFELALSAAACTMEYGSDLLQDEVLTLSDVQFTHPLVYDENVSSVVRTAINLHPRGGKHSGTFTVSSIGEGKEQQVHCTGFFQRKSSSAISSKLQVHGGTIERGKSALRSGGAVHHETLRTRTIYDLVFPRVVQYSKMYQVINSMTLDGTNGQGFATIQMPTEHSNERYVIQPVFVDALLHAAGFLINSQASSGDAYICGQVDSSKTLFDLDYSMPYEVYCATSQVNDGVIVADAWAVEVGGAKRVVAFMKRMRFTRLRLNSLSRLLSQAAGGPERTQSPVPTLRCTTPPLMPKPKSAFRPCHRYNTLSSLSTATAVNGLFDYSAEISKIVSDVCGVPLSAINLNSNIADLGVDSLIWIELVGQLKSIVPNANFDVSKLMLSRTIADLANAVASVGQCPVPDLSSFKMPLMSPVEHENLTPSSIISPVEELNTVSEVKSILGKVLDIAPHSLRVNDRLDALGLDSLGSIEALHDLQQSFHLALPQNFFQLHPTIGAVQDYVMKFSALSPVSRTSRWSSSSKWNDSSPVTKVSGLSQAILPLQNFQDDSSPLFLVHDGSGLSHCYSRIGDLERPLWGVSNPKLLSGDRWEGGIPEMAEHYIDQITPMMTDKGCILGGWSFGGVVAYHMACELMRRGEKVIGVVLIDSPSPFSEKPLPEELIEAVIQAGSHTSPANEHQTKIVELARIQMSHSTNSLISYDPLLSGIDRNMNPPKVVMLRCRDAYSLTGIVSESIPFLEDRSDPKAIVSDWEKLTQANIPVLDIPGHHFEPFHPRNVTALTEQLGKAIAYLEDSF